MLYDKEQVLKFMPHREPFLFIDSVESIEGFDYELAPGEVLISPKELEGLKIVANFYTREDHPIFAGHFPGNPLLPGVVQVEMMAQASCFAVAKLCSDPFSIELQTILMGVSNAKFRRPITPGMHLKIHATCSRVRGSIMSYDCKIFDENNLISEASVLASVKFEWR